MAAVVAGCAAGQAFRRGEEAARNNDWDAAVAHYREAVQADPDRSEFKMALERAMLNASHLHLDAARQAEARGDLDVALREYKQASEYDPSNRQAAAKVVSLEQTIRDRIEAARPQAADAADARARAADVVRAGAQSRVARSAQHPVHERERPRHPELHRCGDRYQRHLHQRLP